MNIIYCICYTLYSLDVNVVQMLIEHLGPDTLSNETSSINILLQMLLEYPVFTLMMDFMLAVESNIVFHARFGDEVCESVWLGNV